MEVCVYIILSAKYVCTIFSLFILYLLLMVSMHREYEYLLPMRLLQKPLTPLQGSSSASSADASAAADDLFSGCDWRHVITDPTTERPVGFPPRNAISSTQTDSDISVNSIGSSGSGHRSENMHRIESVDELIARFDAQLSKLVGSHRYDKTFISTALLQLSPIN